MYGCMLPGYLEHGDERLCNGERVSADQDMIEPGVYQLDALRSIA